MIDNMEGNSNESDKDKTGQQNNNSIETESNQQSSSTNEKELKIESKMVNNESNGCDDNNSVASPSKTENDNNHQNVKTKDDTVTDMEMGSPEKQLAPANDSKSSNSNSPPKSESNANKEPNVDFKVIYNKKKYDISLSPDTDIGALKTHLQPIIDIPPAMMKVMIKGLAKDEMTLKKLGVTKGSKVMVVGSSLNDVLSLSTAPKDTPKDLSSPKETSSSETCKQKQHKKILDKGKPDDVMPGILGIKEPLPSQPLSGMVNKHGGKVRLTFKLESDQVWIGTKERTEKLPLNSIKSVVSEPIDGHKEYHIVALQLGPTEASRYWIYWVPAQYVDAIKDCILGKWQLF